MMLFLRFRVSLSRQVSAAIAIGRNTLSAVHLCLFVSFLAAVVTFAKLPASCMYGIIGLLSFVLSARLCCCVFCFH